MVSPGNATKAVISTLKPATTYEFQVPFIHSAC